MKANTTFRDRVLPAALVVFFVGALIASVWVMTAPRGADTWGHLFKAEYLARTMQSEGAGAFFTADWMPNWYLGDPFRTYYPPLTTQLLGPLTFLLGSSDIAWRVFLSCFFAGFSLLTFAYLNRTWGAWPAMLGTLLAAGAAYQLRTIFFEGNLPRVLALLALPAIAWLTDRLLVSRERRAPIVFVLAAAWAWAITAHPQQALIFAYGMIFYVIFRLILDPEVPLRRTVLCAAALALGAMFSAFWLVPAYSHGELASVPFLPQEKIPLFSASPTGFLAGFDLTGGAILFGIGVILTGFLAISVRPDPRRAAWFIAGMLCILFSLGPNGVFFNLLPLNGQLLPERFLNFSAFALPVAAAGVLPIGRKSRALRISLVLTLACVDLLPGVGLLRDAPYPQEQAVLAGVSAFGEGRVALMTYPEPTAQEVYFAGQNADLINGWALENTPHHASLRRVLSAPEWGPAWLGALFSRWDVRTIVVAGGLEADPARAFAAAEGFRKAGDLGRYEVWRQDAPAAPVQILPAHALLAAGSGLAPMLAAFPHAEEATMAQFLGDQSGRLLDYPVMAFYRFAGDASGAQSLEGILHTYLEAGGVVLVDLSGMEDQFGTTTDFLGVQVFRLSFTNRIDLAWLEPGDSRPASLDLRGLAEQGWSGAAYDGLDAVLATAEKDGQQYPVFGYKNFGRGRAWFVGANLLYYALETGNDSLREVIRSAVLESAAGGLPGVVEAADFPPVPVAAYTETGHGLFFQYAAAEPVQALISYTYSPRWIGWIDGVEIPLQSREGLIRLALPAGPHVVEIRNRPLGTLWPVLGWGISLFGIALGGLAILLERRRKPAPAPEHSLEETFQQAISGEGGAAYGPCAHCGFRLAESSPPTPETYPFHASICPICGSGMDNEGYAAGQELTPEDRNRRLNEWLHSHGYDPRMVYTVWGFSADEFFHHIYR